MRKQLINSAGLDAKGVGPQIMLRTSPFLISAIAVEIFRPKWLEISFLTESWTSYLGWIWLCIGIVLFITTIVQFSVNFPKGKLITNGMYAWSRNPIYSTWILFILPGLGLGLNNWLFFVSSVAMCLSTILLVKEEESMLLKCFGKTYEAYRTQVGLILRLPKFYFF